MELEDHDRPPDAPMSVPTGPRIPRSGGISRLWKAGPVVSWLAIGVLAAVVGVVTAVNVLAGLFVALLVLAFGVFVIDPILVAVIALPGSILVQRVGGASTNLSAADLLVFAAAVVCLFHVEWSRAVHLRRFMRGIVWYQAVLLLIVVAHPFKGDIIEWFHRLSYLAGAALVGWVVGYHGRARASLRLFLWGAALLALLAIEHSLSSGFQPAQWGVYQKNTIGSIMWVAAVVAQLNPPWLGIAKVEARAIEVMCLIGLLASQSRQAAILLVLALGTAALLNSDVRGRFKTLIFIGIPSLALVYFSVSLALQNNPKFNSLAIRFGQIDAAIHAWHSSPLLGLGMRFYNLPQYVFVTAPPNSLVDNLASTGIVGSIAFFFLVAVTFSALNKLPRIYGVLGLVILLGHYVDGLFDTFWIGGLSIPPFIIAGISLGLADADPEQERVPDLLAQASRSKQHRSRPKAGLSRAGSSPRPDPARTGRPGRTSADRPDRPRTRSAGRRLVPE